MQRGKRLIFGGRGGRLIKMKQVRGGTFTLDTRKHNSVGRDFSKVQKKSPVLCVNCASA